MLKTTLFSVLLAAGMQAFAAEPEVTTVIFVNPAEVIESPVTDPGLSANGKEQAVNLSTSLQSTAVAAIYTTYLNRAVQTVEALSKSKQVPLDYFRDTDDPEMIKSIIAAMVKKYKGKTIVICGDARNIPVMAKSLGIKTKDIKEVYDKTCGEALMVKVGDRTAVAQKLNMNFQKKV
ncbi:histidine phosphatase family protein [Chitinophaga defluvii]|uniref:Histidine phosphatase family protein n=1 Tax=Chitinophaga defluvii TaxID=3163343 RepID=A0ABV2T328_9BACT